MFTPVDGPAGSRSSRSSMVQVAVALLMLTGLILLLSTQFSDAAGVEVTDPRLVYSTYLSIPNSGHGLAADHNGNAYIAGRDGYVRKLNATGSASLYITFIGGRSVAIDVDSDENAYIASRDSSGSGCLLTKLDPTGLQMYQITCSGDAAEVAVDTSGNAYVVGHDFYDTGDAYLSKVDATGTSIYSISFGGSALDVALDVAADSDGNAYVTGGTSSADFPGLSGFQTTYNSTGDAFVTKIDQAGLVEFSTYLGGNDIDQGHGIDLDAAGNIYVTGYTESSDFPLENPVQPMKSRSEDIFVTKLNAAGTALFYSTYLGGNDIDLGNKIAVDDFGNAHVVGYTEYSTDFPTVNPIQAVTAGRADGVIATLSPSGSALLFSSYFGGSNTDETLNVAVDSAGILYVSGYTLSDDLPTANALQPNKDGQQNAFVLKLANTPGGSNAVIQPVDGSTGATPISLTFSEVTRAGMTGLTTSNTGPELPGGFSLGDPATFYDIDTTAEYAAPLTVCITYDPAQYGEPANLSLLHFENDAWADVTTSNDTLSDTICGEVSSLSPFVVAELVNQQPIVDAGGPYSGNNGSAIPLSGASASDPDSDPLTYAWTVDSELCSFSDPSILQPSVTCIYHGNYMATLTVSDGVNDQVSAAATVEVTDPRLVYSTYLSIPNDGVGIAADDSGNVYVAGRDGYVRKLNSTGTASLYTTFIDGRNVAIDVDSDGNAYIASRNSSGSGCLLTKLGPTGLQLYQITCRGNVTDVTADTSGNAYVVGYGGTNRNNYEAYLSKVNISGTDFIYDIVFGGSSSDVALDVAADSDGNAYVTGYTGSVDLPELNGFQTTYNGGGDAFVTKINQGGVIEFSTYLGGEDSEEGHGIALDADGNIYVTGWTERDDFPTMNPLQSASAGSDDIFVTKLNPSGSALVYSTYLGGSDVDLGNKIAVDDFGNAHVVGFTDYSDDFPTVNPIHTATAGGFDGLIATLSPSGSTLLFSSYFGGDDDDDETLNVAVDAAGVLYVSGYTVSDDLPTANALQPNKDINQYQDAFVLKLANTPGGSNAVVQPVDGSTGTTPVSLTFSEVTQAGITTLTTSATGPELPGGFSLGDPATYYDISTTAEYSELLTVCITYDPAQYSDPAGLRLLHFENDVWSDVTTSNDTLNGTICGEVTSLSPFAIVELVPLADAGGPYLGAQDEPIVFDGSGSFTPNAGALLTYAWDFGDGSIGSSVRPTHSYADAGIYDACLTINDGSADSDPNCTMVVIYDPDGGFVTGGGWIESPEGACRFVGCSYDTIGRASFGFVSKYKKGSNIPTGQTEFQFKAGNLDFHSSSYQWLVVAGHKAMYKGEGNINGEGSYGFMISAVDEKLTTSTNVDMFRIKIWDKNNGDVIVYDNQVEDAEDTDPTTAISGGSIVIHKK